MAAPVTSIRLNTKLSGKGVRVRSAKSRTKDVPMTAKEAVALQKFKDLMKKYGGKLSFEGYDE
jgi:hypothetical protein